MAATSQRQAAVKIVHFNPLATNFRTTNNEGYWSLKA